MVDEDQFRRTYEEVMTRPCPFEKAILTRACACPQAGKTHIGEREAVNCSSDGAQETCVAFVQQLRRRANFVLGLTRTPGALPHAQAFKIQCGGLLGLQRSLDPFADESRVADVNGLLKRALKRFGTWDEFPYPEIMQTVSAYQQWRRRARRGR